MQKSPKMLIPMSMPDGLLFLQSETAIILISSTAALILQFDLIAFCSLTIARYAKQISSHANAFQRPVLIHSEWPQRVVCILEICNLLDAAAMHIAELCNRGPPAKAGRFIAWDLDKENNCGNINFNARNAL
jgi:hypothetical protein